MAEDRTQGRAEAERTRRRRRGEESLAASKRLPIPPEIEAQLKAEGRTPRWVNDEGNRMHRFTVLDDYDKVAGVEPVPVGVNPNNGEPILAHLLSKPTEFIRQDQQEADERRKATETALFQSPNAAAQVAGNPDNAKVVPEGKTYVTSESKIRRGGNQLLD